MKSLYWSPTVAVFFACGIYSAVADEADDQLNALSDLSPQDMLEEMTVLASYTPMENSADIERADSEIVDAIDADQLEKFGDSNVAAAAMRIVGVSIQNDKYVVVRGLDGRYISSTLNDNLMPTTDPLRRDVQLDLFPSNILETIKIQKSYSADMPGDSTGGSMGMYTKGLPDDLTTKISVSGGYNFDVTGNDIVTYDGGGSDWMTYDDGARDVPSEVDSVFQGPDGSYSVSTCNVTGCTISFEENARLGQQFPVNYNLTTESASPDFGLGVSHGNLFDQSFGSIGYYLSAALSNSTDDRVDAFVNEPGREAKYQRSKKSSKLSAYMVLGLEDAKDGEWLSRTIFLRQSEDVTKFEDGYLSYEERDYTRALLRWNEREFWGQQFSGKHFLATTHELEWRAGVSQTTMYEPDRRTWQYVGGNFLSRATERRYSDLSEDGTDFGVSYLAPIDFTNSFSTAFKVGYLYNLRDRTWDQARYSFQPGRAGEPDDRTLDVETLLSNESLANENYRLRKSTTSTDSFLSEIETSAFYLNTETVIKDSITIVLGARQEDNTQTIEYPYRGSSDPEDDKNILDESELLPAFSVNWAMNDYWQFRLSASKTVSRPGVIERSEASLFDPETDKQIFGNPELESASIDNFDLRGEYYFDDGGNISLALFTKAIENPIERALVQGSGSTRDATTFRNSKSADLMGVELDFNKVLVDANSFALDLAGNISVIDSEVDLDEVSIQLEGEDAIGRELQGQSPFLANVHFGFEHHGSQQAVNLMVNYFDDTLSSIGATDLGGEYEKSRTTLDMNYSKTFENESVIKVKLTNILNSATEWEQNDVIIESYKEGTELSVSYSYSF